MARKLAKSKLDDFGWSSKQWSCLSKLWGKESAWNYKAVGPTNDHGIPQRHMSKNTKKEIHAFQSDPVKQINWGLNYIDSRYSSPCGAWSFWEVNRWYQARSKPKNGVIMFELLLSTFFAGMQNVLVGLLAILSMLSGFQNYRDTQGAVLRLFRAALLHSANDHNRCSPIP